MSSLNMLEKYTPKKKNKNILTQKIRPLIFVLPCFLRFCLLFLDVPFKSLRKSRPWSNFTGFSLYCWGVGQSKITLEHNSEQTLKLSRSDPATEKVVENKIKNTKMIEIQ